MMAGGGIRGGIRPRRLRQDRRLPRAPTRSPPPSSPRPSTTASASAPDTEIRDGLGRPYRLAEADPVAGVAGRLRRWTRLHMEIAESIRHTNRGIAASPSSDRSEVGPAIAGVLPRRARGAVRPGAASRVIAGPPPSYRRAGRFVVRAAAIARPSAASSIARGIRCVLDRSRREERSAPGGGGGGAA